MSWSSKPRTEPYTDAGIKRAKCIRCGAKARHQWNICADNGYFRPVCVDCDIDLNRMVLRWAGDPDAEAKADKYETEARNPK